VVPVPPFATVSVPEMEASVVVDTHVGTPETSASTWPFAPAVVVPSREVPFPIKTVLVCMFAQPVPPLVMARIDEPTSLTRSMVAVLMAPAVAFKKPERVPTEREPKYAAVEEAYVEEILVVDALSNCDVEEAVMPLWNHTGEEVADVTTAKFVV
jgi:hypothetical protein